MNAVRAALPFAAVVCCVYAFAAWLLTREKRP